MALNLSQEHLVFDGLEAVTVNGVAVTSAYRSDIEEAEGAPTDGIYLHANVEWQIPTGVLIAEPRVGQDIVDGSGNVFTILAIRKPFLNDYFGCACRLASIELFPGVFGADRSITRYPAITVVDEEGSRFVVNSTADPAFTDIACRIQPMPGEIVEVMGKRVFDRVFHIFVASEIDLNYGDVLRDDTAIMYTVQSWENRERIDELSLIICHIME